MGMLDIILGLNSKPKEQRKTDAKTAAKQSETLRPFKAFMDGMLENLAIERMDELTLRKAITRFVEGKPKPLEPAKGALIVQPHREGKIVFWAFLKEDNSLMCDEAGKPFGFKAICSKLDAELTATLKGNELLIFE